MKTKKISTPIVPRLRVLNDKQHSNKLIVKTADYIYLLERSGIIYLQAMGNYTKIFTEHNGMICSAKTLKYYEEQLSDRNFSRPHQSYMVNLNKVDKVSVHHPYYITLCNSAQVPMSRSRKADFLSDLL